MILLALVLYVWWMAPFVRYRLRKWQSRNWPSVRGTIQKGEVLRGGPTRYQAFVYRSLLGYAYKVDDSPHAGLFVLVAGDEETAVNLQKQCDGKGVTVRYSRTNPDISFLVENQLMDRPIVQNPWWLR